MQPLVVPSVQCCQCSLGMMSVDVMCLLLHLVFWHCSRHCGLALSVMSYGLWLVVGKDMPSCANTSFIMVVKFYGVNQTAPKVMGYHWI